ncbi:MAG TPA: sugar ABC transporter permease [Candidatus Faecivicinus avistercoris]|nr:sugar ABC transporter permease [Candidatus Faecivicinus avistercoris]
MLNAKISRHEARARVTYFLFVLPVLIVILAVTFYPAAYNVFISFRNESLRNSSAEFVGMRNYVRLFQDELVWQALGRTIVYLVFSVAFRVLLGLGLALLLKVPSRMNVFTRTTIVLPWIMSEIMASSCWLWLLNHQTGLINAVLQFLGLEKVGWLVYPNLAMGSIIGVSVWKNLAYTYLLLFAALQQISVEVYEAAKIDGCTAFKALIHITLPLIRPTLLVVCVTVSITAFGQFSLPYSLTGGGPQRATQLIGLYMHEQAFTYNELSYGATIGVLIFAINIVMTLIYNRVLRQDG